MTMKKAKNIGTWLLAGFCLGTGAIIGWIASNFTWSVIMIGFFGLIGFVVLAVLVFATIFDDTTEQEEDIHTYPTPEGWDKKHEN
jgi:phage shock protein PspC (stress-responsive transcriptional regulator)